MTPQQRICAAGDTFLHISTVSDGLDALDSLLFAAGETPVNLGGIAAMIESINSELRSYIEDGNKVTFGCSS